jgi:hypothetical protein
MVIQVRAQAEVTFQPWSRRAITMTLLPIRTRDLAGRTNKLGAVEDVVVGRLTPRTSRMLRVMAFKGMSTTLMVSTADTTKITTSVMGGGFDAFEGYRLLRMHFFSLNYLAHFLDF